MVDGTSDSGHESAIERARQEALKDRRKYLAAGGAPGGDRAQIPLGALGLAFSGGGIRSATISLGVAQALARRDRLLDFDYMSTVSGGGYFGSFLRSLFLPETARGSSGRVIDDKPDKRDFAIDALTAETHAPMVGHLISPVQWLRQNGRYLAPGGSSDVLTAATYVARNWVAMLCVFALPVAVAFLLLAKAFACLAPAIVSAGRNGNQSLLLSAWVHSGKVPVGLNSGQVAAWFARGFVRPGTQIITISPLIALAPLLVWFSLACALANWLTVYTVQRRVLSWQRLGDHPVAIVLGTSALALAALALSSLLLWPQPWLPGFLLWPPLADGLADVVKVGMSLLAGAIVILWAVIAQMRIRSALKPDLAFGPALYGNELRRYLLRFNAMTNLALFAVLGMAAIDTLARFSLGSIGTPRIFYASVLAPLGTFLVHRLSALFSGSSSSGQSAMTNWVSRYLWQAAFVVALALWSGLAVLIDMGAHSVANGPGRNFLPALIVLLVMTLITGASNGFINLSSLHSLYAARLTRAYLGASNRVRLEAGSFSRVTGYQDQDVIKARVYQQQPCAAPLHLINVTLNETIASNGSQLTERDRKGLPLVIAPEGILLNPGVPNASGKPGGCYPWDGTQVASAEGFTVGQLAAISGAAVSSAMGANTTLGGSLLFTYANIRLGYWWNRGKIGEIRPPLWHPGEFFGAIFGTYTYLFREMLARYRSTTALVNLSDGGHFENTAAYELLRRKVRTILICDNGADPDYDFADLENLVRKARLDLGVEIGVGSPADVTRCLGHATNDLFLNGRDGDWRARARKHDVSETAFALLLIARRPAWPDSHIILLKPSLFGGLPADVWGYALANPTFPNETTANQFFNEAQWESYRKIGFVMIDLLLAHNKFGADLFRLL